jgi:hypothetical protein
MSSSQIKCNFGVDCKRPSTCKFQHTADLKSAGHKHDVEKHKTKQNKNEKPQSKKFTAAHQAMLKKSISVMSGHLKTRKELKSLAADFDAKYVSVDAKGATANPYADKIQLNEANITSVKAIVASELKGMNVPIRLVGNYLVANTSAGVCAYVTALDPATSIEWASIAALFEEIRTHKVTLHYHPKSVQQVAITGSAAFTSMGAYSVDATAFNALTGTNDAFDATYHRLYDVCTVTSSSSVEQRSFHNTSLVYHPPSAPFPNTAAFSNVPIAGSSWTSTAGTSTSGTSGVVLLDT